MLISILIPAYNVEQYLVECLDSIFSQIDNNCEIILIDDASTDNTLELALEYQKKHDNFKVYQNEVNQGLAVTRNLLLEKSKAEYIWFIDSDDFLEKNSYVQVSRDLIKFNPDILFTSFYKKNQDNTKIKLIRQSNYSNKLDNINIKFLKNFLLSDINYIWCKIFKKSCVNGLTFYPKKKFEDIYFCPKILLNCKLFYYSNIVTINYRTREGSISYNANVSGFSDIAFSWRSVYDYYLQHNQPQEILDLLVYKIVRAYIRAVREIQKQYKNDENMYSFVNTELVKYLPISINQVKYMFLKRGWFIRLIKFNIYLKNKC